MSHFVPSLSGHARPLVHLAARLVKLRPINLTILTSTAYYPRITTELARNFDPEEEEYAKRVRLVSYPAHAQVSTSLRTICRVIAISDVAFLRSDEGDKAFEEAWVTLCEGRELVCMRTGTRFAPLPKPKAIILDVRALQAIALSIC